MSTLSEPGPVLHYLESASAALSQAHVAAGEEEDGRSDLTGPVRDLLFGITTAVDALAQMIEEGRFGGGS